MRTIYLIRHGEPDFPNGERLCLGTTNLPLSRNGAVQAALLGEWFRDKASFALYCSPMARTAETAEAIGEAVPVPGLKEQAMGAWEGLSFARIRQEYPEQYRQRGLDPDSVHIPGAEPAADFRGRVQASFSRLLTETAGDFALVTHAGVLRALLGALLGLSPKALFRLRIDYGSVWVLQQEGDTYHVQEADLLPRPPVSTALRQRLAQALGSEHAAGEWLQSYVPVSGEIPANISALWQWKPDMIRFMDDASRYGSYDRELAENILPCLTPEDTVCDMGCGLAYLSMALSPHVADIAAVDVNLNALSALQRNCKAWGISNLHPLCTDASSLPEDMQFDAMIFCFFGNQEEILSIAAKHCRKQLFIVRRNYSTHRFSRGKHPLPGDDFAGTCAYLQALGIPFQTAVLSLEHGQPFRNLEDARRFFALYSKDSNAEKQTDLFLSERLKSTGREDFPYYLPQAREVGIIRLNADDLR